MGREESRDASTNQQKKKNNNRSFKVITAGPKHALFLLTCPFFG